MIDLAEVYREGVIRGEATRKAEITALRNALQDARRERDWYRQKLKAYVNERFGVVEPTPLPHVTNFTREPTRVKIEAGSVQDGKIAIDASKITGGTMRREDIKARKIDSGIINVGSSVLFFTSDGKIRRGTVVAIVTPRNGCFYLNDHETRVFTNYSYVMKYIIQTKDGKLHFESNVLS